jgi:2'-5' RNA ligase
MFYSIMGSIASEGRLFLAVLPDVATARRIHRLATVLKRAHGFTGKLILPERLHVSLFFLGGLHEEDVAYAAREAIGTIRMPPFKVCFDLTASFGGRPGSRAFVLWGSDGLSELKSFRRVLAIELTRDGLKRCANTNFEPHITLLYDDRSVEEYPVAEPISWTVNEIVLIQSKNGHTHPARWRLHA